MAGGTELCTALAGGGLRVTLRAARRTGLRDGLGAVLRAALRSSRRGGRVDALGIALRSSRRADLGTVLRIGLRNALGQRVIFEYRIQQGAHLFRGEMLSRKHERLQGQGLILKGVGSAYAR